MNSGFLVLTPNYVLLVGPCLYPLLIFYHICTYSGASPQGITAVCFVDIKDACVTFGFTVLRFWISGIYDHILNH